MNKDTLKFIIYLLLATISIFLIYSIWSFDVSENIQKVDNNENKIENFTIAHELSKLTNEQHYNLLESNRMTSKSNSHNITITNDKFIKQIYIITENSNFEIPLDLQIIVKDNNGNEKYANMKKYKPGNPSPTDLSYSGNSVNFNNLVDMNGELLYGKNITLKSDSYKFKFQYIYVFGNETGKDYKLLGGERDITSNFINPSTSTTSATYNGSPTSTLINNLSRGSEQIIRNIDTSNINTTSTQSLTSTTSTNPISSYTPNLETIESNFNYKYRESKIDPLATFTIISGTNGDKTYRGNKNIPLEEFKIQGLQECLNNDICEGIHFGVDNDKRHYYQLIGSPITENMIKRNVSDNVIYAKNIESLETIELRFNKYRESKIDPNISFKIISGTYGDKTYKGDKNITLDKFKFQGLQECLNNNVCKGIHFGIDNDKKHYYQLIGSTITENMIKRNVSDNIIYTKYIESFDNNTTTTNSTVLSSNKPFLINKIKFRKLSNNSNNTNSISDLTQTLRLADNNTFNLSLIKLDNNILTHYYDNPILIMTDLTSFSITLENGYAIDKIYGKPAATEDIQNFKFVNGLISFRDSLNPDTIVGDESLMKKNAMSMDILDVLNYQKKINTELKELDLNKFNIRELYNQKLDIANTIDKINRISNNYLKLIKDSDEYNANKFTETIQILQYLKAELEKKERNKKEYVNLNLEIPSNI